MRIPKHALRASAHALLPYECARTHRNSRMLFMNLHPAFALCAYAFACARTRICVHAHASRKFAPKSAAGASEPGSIVPEGLKGLPFRITITVPEELQKGSLFGPENAGQVLWATQIWMSIDAALIALIGYRLLLRRRYRGQVALWLLAIYAVMRFLIEQFRGDEIRGMWFGEAISTSQLISILTLVVCTLLLWRNRGLRDEGAPLSSAGPPPSTPAGDGAG